MSPRAAWQLEAYGFTDVYDFVEGKVAWLSRGLPTEGEGPHYATVGEVASREHLVTCRLGCKASDVDARAHDHGNYCIVLNEHDIVLGRLRHDVLAAHPDEPVEQLMEPGPTTVRPTEGAEALFARMVDRGVPAVLVTTKLGQIVGVAHRDDLHELIHGHR